ncbi:hypothetical protein EXS70_02285 [Candidatus Peribacteria bacterium]|nr:hypothetical protein [Candidatus Peribacteria bacterium]
MRHLHRIHLLVALLIPIVSISSGAMLIGTLSGTTLEDALDRVRDSARKSATLESIGDESEKAYHDAKQRLQRLGKQKREVRLHIAALLHSLRTIGNQSDALLLSQELAVRNFAREQGDFGEFLRYAHVRQLNVTAGPMWGGWVLRRLLGMSLGESVDADLRDTALARAREQILMRLLAARESDQLSREQLHSVAGESGDQLAELRDEHETLIDEYADVLHMLDNAETTLRASAEQLEQLKRDTAQVQQDIDAIQSELDGIVFIVRPGGATGYTYVLIGHRGGYATVYGHLNHVFVNAGDTVSAGDVIGISGGTPGTEGAGRRTTGPHLHFEVILRGEHVDPMTVLPK